MTASPDPQRTILWAERLAACRARITTPPPLIVEGKLTRMVGLTLEAAGCQAPIGARCNVQGPEGHPVEAEVVVFSG